MTDAAKQIKKKENAGKWEIETVGRFLLELYHQQVISPRNNWTILKHRIREEFSRFLATEVNSNARPKFLELAGTSDIGRLLFYTNFLINTPRGSDLYRIKSLTLFQYRNHKLEEYDEIRKNNGTDIDDFQRAALSAISSPTKTSSQGNATLWDPALTPFYEVDENTESYPLEYEGIDIRQRDPNFILTNMGCYICQQNFDSPVKFEEHVEEHNDESDFKLLKAMKKFNAPIFKLSYKLCKKSHYFCFLMETSLAEIVIEKIIIIQSRSMYYVCNARVPYELPANGKDTFFVDSHLFTIYLEQPIVIVFHGKRKKDGIYVEQHHFMRTETFPVVNLIVNPCRLSSNVTFKAKFQLLRFLPPAEIRKALKYNFAIEQLGIISNEFNDYFTNGKTFTQQNIREAMNILLQIEDMDTLRDYSNLVQRNAKLRKFDNEYTLKMRVEKNIKIEDILFPYDEVMIIPETIHTISITCEPSLDLILKNTDDVIKMGKKVKQTTFYGEVERVSRGSVTFKCRTKILEDQCYMIIFRPTRLPLRYQYRALESLNAMPGPEVSRFLFPQRITTRSLPDVSLDLQNKKIADNPEQLQAVKIIIDVALQDAPYIIFGPPGTGKTTTAVEAILQLYLHRPDAKILVTAGSNSACDQIALRLCKVLSQLNHVRSMTRIYARSFEQRLDNVDELLLEYSNLYSTHFYPDIGFLHEYRIVICTLTIVGKLALGKFGKDSTGAGIYTHVFVDEVAASTEAETLVGIIGTLSSKSNLIISGDHKQLGPILNSQRAIELGLDVSLMDRLLKRDCYAVDEQGNYNRCIQTRLYRNYRSHPDIVNLYNRLYYNNELRALVSDDVASLCEKWHRAPSATYPIIFHSVFGAAERGSRSQSWYNQRELEVVMDYVKDLMYFGVNGQKIKQEDIGIISPYKKQYTRIQEELNLRQWYDIETGSVEIFQGKEKTIIITSFVRSFTSTLGFLENPRRLNVTLSRAKALLILIGNPKTLSLNADFKFIINECQRNNTLVGASFYDFKACSESDAIVGANNVNGKDETNLHMKAATSLDDKNPDSGKKPPSKNKKKAKKAHNKTNNDLGAAHGVEETSQVQLHQERLGKNMKKNVKPTSQGKQLKNFKMYHNLLMSDAVDSTATPSPSVIKSKAKPSPSVIDLKSIPSLMSINVTAPVSPRFNFPKATPRPSAMDKLFDGLPSVPQVINSKIVSTANNDLQRNTVEEMEKEIHEKMLKLKMKPPTPNKTVFSINSVQRDEVTTQQSETKSINFDVVLSNAQIPQKRTTISPQSSTVAEKCNLNSPQTSTATRNINMNSAINSSIQQIHNLPQCDAAFSSTSISQNINATQLHATSAFAARDQFKQPSKFTAPISSYAIQGRPWSSFVTHERPSSSSVARETPTSVYADFEPPSITYMVRNGRQQPTRPMVSQQLAGHHQSRPIIYTESQRKTFNNSAASAQTRQTSEPSKPSRKCIIS